MFLLYNLFIFFYLFAIHIASFFNSKAKLWINGRKNIFKKISLARIDHHSSLIWVHCASLGEFEQGRPLIEKIKKQYPEVKILLTFFSPSGYEIRKNYSGADHIFYLPIDTPANARKFIKLLKPKAVFFVKYEFWFNYLNELKEQQIPTYLVSGIFRKEHYFFKKYNSWFRKQLVCFNHFYLQDKISSDLLNKIGYINTNVVGDMRFDRVVDISENIKPIHLIEQFKQDKQIFIVGSSWKEDEKIIAEYFVNNEQRTTSYKLIIVPHEVNEERILFIEKLFKNKCLRYSQAKENNIKTAEVLIIDNIGMLSSLYQYATIAFIGGGFGKGVHNILEAATFGLPVIFGSNYKKFTETKELIHLGGAFTVKNQQEFERTMQLLNNKEVLQTASHIAKYYVKSKVGATDRILNSHPF